jgi:hypothetical protein
LGVSSSLFWESKAEALEFSWKLRHASVGDVQGFS